MLQHPFLTTAAYAGYPNKINTTRAGNYDLRVIVMRHGERIDQTLGPNWLKSPQVRAQIPRRLPKRANQLLYAFDPPITREGEQASALKGQQLMTMGLTADYCYCSPTSRTVITSADVLIGMNRAAVPLKIEPALFETMSWNPQLQLLGNVSPFMSTQDWTTAGYTVDHRYHRLTNYLNPNETEQDYYNRSAQFLHTIEKRHGSGRSRKTVLVVGHASSTIIYPTIALRHPFDAVKFGQDCGNVQYLSTVILERDAYSKIWSVKHLR
ncbi:unnamed protein product [Didymodactylos carnosus]|uniref:Phosphoglycerate mutase n=1 Tax=Didymodactylos carnosus TaxID=1234261 RepID=A0A814IES4_9BILA|nr:unnamed protein product [Didymodactylos carnosus]CAF1022493.1 unnamed protein product [Didymodactylos carnosus]CAF3648918.1 unnamed protein product [Didymodactylos carnosus]CAF3793870.1 unnamed protein product [Didymodactylos carnosus]